MDNLENFLVSNVEQFHEDFPEAPAYRLPNDKIKQVIIIRKDLKMPPGKMCAMAAHAAMIFLCRYLFDDETNLTDTQVEWLKGSFTKVVVRADSEEQLLQIYNAAEEAGLVVHKMIDNGETIFNNIKTLTAIAVGPDYSSKIDPLTRSLKCL